MDIETFAAARAKRLTTADDEMRSLVRKALTDYNAPTAWKDVVEGAGVLWLEMFEAEAPDAYPDAALKDFTSDLAALLAKTSEPTNPPEDAQVERVTLWIGTYTVNSATYHGNRAAKGKTMTWVTMHDNDVRHTHRETDGQRVSVNGTFDVGGYKLHFPGEPVGPPSIWINCRCMLAGSKVRTAMTAAATKADEKTAPEIAPDGEEIPTDPADTAPEDVVDPEEIAPTDEVDDPNVELVDDIREIPVHGVATIEGKPTGDGRMFATGSLSNRDLPLPMRFEFVGTHGGDTSDVATVGVIDEMWMAGNEMRYRGRVMMDSEWGPETVAGIVDGRYKGISVEVDDITLDVSQEREAMKQRILQEQAAQAGEGDAEEEPGQMTEADIEAFLDAMIGDGTVPLTTFSKARVCGFTIVPIGAYAEAYIALGSEFPDELSQDAQDALAACGCGTPSEADIAEANADYEAAVAALVAAGTYAPGTHDGPGWITHPKATARIRRYWVRGKGAAKIRWGTPGDFNRCRKQLAKYVQNPDWLAGLCANMHKEAIGIWPGMEDGGRRGHHDGEAAPMAIIASGMYPDGLRASMFADPHLTEPTGIRIEGDHIFGHIAFWDVCHIGFDKLCRTAPRSLTDYGYFATGLVETEDGPVRVGQITMGIGHAEPDMDLFAAAEHYDNVNAAVADVAVGEDEHGIWFSGVLRKSATLEQRQQLLASGRLSGDWRRFGHNLEMVGALVVNIPGFGIPETSLAASGGVQTSLVAAGIVQPSLAASGELSSSLDSDERTAAIARLAVEEYRYQEKREARLAEIAPAKKALRQRRLVEARAKLSEKE